MASYPEKKIGQSQGKNNEGIYPSLFQCIKLTQA